MKNVARLPLRKRLKLWLETKWIAMVYHYYIVRDWLVERKIIYTTKDWLYERKVFRIINNRKTHKARKKYKKIVKNLENDSDFVEMVQDISCAMTDDARDNFNMECGEYRSKGNFKPYEEDKDYKSLTEIVAETAGCSKEDAYAIIMSANIKRGGCEVQTGSFRRVECVECGEED